MSSNDITKLNDFKLYEIDGELYSLAEIKGFIDFNKELTYSKQYLEEQVNDLKDKVAALKKQYDDFYTEEYMKRIDECNRLWSELYDIKHMSVWEFANKYCNDKQLEEAGHQLARDLLGK